MEERRCASAREISGFVLAKWRGFRPPAGWCPAAVRKALDPAKYEAVALTIGRDGRWYGEKDQMLDTSADPPEELRRKVTSPGGTTEAALAVLGERNFDEMVAAAVEAATRRGRALSGN